MSKFIHAHAGDADWKVALGSCWRQIRHQPQDARKPTLGWCYLTDHYSEAAGHILEALREHMPGVHWVGAVGVGVGAGAIEYFDEPAMALMLADMPPASFKIFSRLEALEAEFERLRTLHRPGSRGWRKPRSADPAEGPERKDFFRLSVWRAFLGEESLCASPTPRCMEAYPAWPSGPKYRFFRG